MTDVRITIQTQTPQKATRGVGIGGLIARDSSIGWQASYDNPFLLQKESYADSVYYRAMDATSLAVLGIDRFFAQSNDQQLWVYRFGTGLGGVITDDPSFTSPDGSNTTFACQQSPVSAMTSVKIDYKDGNGPQTVLPTDYTVNQNGTLFDGSITFTGTWVYSGTTYTTAPLGATVYLSYTYNPLGEAFRALREKDIQLLCYAYDPTEMTSAFTYSGISLLEDYRYGMMEGQRCAAMAKWRMFFGMLPRHMTPSSLDTGFGDVATPRYFRVWAQSQLSDEHTVLIGHRSEQDVGCAFMGVVAGTEPQSNIDKQPISVSMDDAFERTAVFNFENSAMCCLDRPWEANYSLRIHRGYTTDLTSDNFRYIDYMRVLDDLQFSLIVDTWAQLATNEIRMNIAGMELLRATLQATCYGKQMLGRIDGVSSIVIPLEELLRKGTAGRTAAEEILVQAYKAARVIPNVRLTYLYAGNPQEVEIILGSV